MKLNIINDLDLKKQAEKLGVSVWQTPSFLFLVLGAIIICIMTAVFFITRYYDSPEILVISESMIVGLIFTIGNVIIRDIENVARTNKVKSEFVSIASHELKTPLSEINWEIDLLFSKYSDNFTEKQSEIVRNIEKSNDRMTRLVNDLLEVARIDQNKMILNRKNIDILQIVKEEISNNKILAKFNQVKIELIKETDDCNIMADERKIKLVIDNLLNNAVKYNLSKEGKAEISLKRKNDYLVVSFKDNGIGIPINEQKYVFEKFFRSNNAMRYQTQGTGLGLYIAKNIIEQSGGKLRFESRENEGSTFYFSLPFN